MKLKTNNLLREKEPKVVRKETNNQNQGKRRKFPKMNKNSHSHNKNKMTVMSNEFS